MFACLRVSPCLVSFVAGNRPNITTRRNNKNIINSRNEFTSCLFLLPLCMNKYRNEYLTRFLINYLLDSRCLFFLSQELPLTSSVIFLNFTAVTRFIIILFIYLLVSFIYDILFNIYIYYAVALLHYIL